MGSKHTIFTHLFASSPFWKYVPGDASPQPPPAGGGIPLPHPAALRADLATPPPAIPGQLGPWPDNLARSEQLGPYIADNSARYGSEQLGPDIADNSARSGELSLYI